MLGWIIGMNNSEEIRYEKLGLKKKLKICYDWKINGLLFWCIYVNNVNFKNKI